MAHARVDHLRATGGRAVAAAVGVGTQERAALDHLAGHAELRLRRIEAVRLAATARVVRDAARLVGVLRVTRRVPVGRPLPDVPRHVVQAEAVGGERTHGQRRPRARLGAPRKVAVPEVREPLARRLRLVAPGVDGAVEAAARRVLPLGLGGQVLAGPGGEGGGVLVGDVHHRVVVEPLERRPRTERVLPRCARRPRPPLVQVAQVDRPPRRREHHRAGHEVLGRRAREVGRVERSLRDRDVAGRRHERGEGGVRDLVPVDPDRVDGDVVNRRLLGVVRVRAHPERAAGDEHRVGRRRHVKGGCQ